LIFTFTETRIFCPGFKPLMLINASDLGAFTATGGSTGFGAFLGMVLATFLAEVAAFSATIERAVIFSELALAFLTILFAFSAALIFI